MNIWDIFRKYGSKQRLIAVVSTSIYRNSIYLVSSSVVRTLAGFVFWIVAARLYSTESIGITSALIAAVGFISILSTLGFEFSIIRFLPSYSGKPDKLLNSCFTTSGLAALILSIIFILGLDIWAPDLARIRDHLWLSLSFIALSIAFTVSILTDRSFVALRKAQYALIQSSISGLVRFIPLLIFAGALATYGVFISWITSFIVATTVSLLILLKRASSTYKPWPTLDRKVMNKVGRFSLSNYLVNIFWSAPGLILPLMVIYLLGAEQNAFFYIGWAIGSVLFTIPQAISFTLLAEGAHEEKKLDSNVRRSIKLISLLVIPAVLGILIFGELVLSAFGEAYSQNSIDLLRLLALSVFPLSINYLYVTIRRVQSKMKSVVALTVFVALTTLISSSILIPEHGIVGIGYSWLSAQTIPALILLAIMLLRNLRKKEGLFR